MFRDTSVPIVKRVLNPSTIQRLQNKPRFHQKYPRLAALYPKKVVLSLRSPFHKNLITPLAHIVELEKRTESDVGLESDCFKAIWYASVRCYFKSPIPPLKKKLFIYQNSPTLPSLARDLASL